MRFEERRMTRLYGIIPPTTTPFITDGEVNIGAVRAQVYCLLAAEG
jgi:dihydrodipicolinate synthase/N-acetylneuraminate lyase